MLAALLLLCAVFLFKSKTFYCLLIIYFYSRPPMALQSNLYTVKENLTAIIVGEEQVL